MMTDVMRPTLSFELVERAPRLERLDDGSYALALSAPGVKQSDLKVSVLDGVLKIEGETVTNGNKRTVSYATRLPRDADPDLSTASTVDGILTISIPRKAAEVTEIVVSTTAPTEEDADEKETPYTLTL